MDRGARVHAESKYGSISECVKALDTAPESTSQVAAAAAPAVISPDAPAARASKSAVPHARTHARTHARSHARTHARTRAHTHTNACVRVHACTCACYKQAEPTADDVAAANGNTKMPNAAGEETRADVAPTQGVPGQAEGSESADSCPANSADADATAEAEAAEAAAAAAAEAAAEEAAAAAAAAEAASAAAAAEAEAAAAEEETAVAAATTHASAAEEATALVPAQDQPLSGTCTSGGGLWRVLTRQ